MTKNCKECELKKDLNKQVLQNHYIIDGYAYAFNNELKNDRISLNVNSGLNVERLQQ